MIEFCPRSLPPFPQEWLRKRRRKKVSEIIFHLPTIVFNEPPGSNFRRLVTPLPTLGESLSKVAKVAVLRAEDGKDGIRWRRGRSVETKKCFAGGRKILVAESTYEKRLLHML